MIILSAQRVVSSRREEGVNCALYHVEGPVPRKVGSQNIDTTQALLMDRTPTHYQNQLRPGGNAVTSYVDIVLAAPNDASSFDEVVRLADNNLRHGQPPLQVSTPAAALELNMNIGLYPRATSELSELVALLKLLLPRTANAPPRAVNEPLRVLVTHTEGSTCYRLDPDSERRLRALDEHWGPSLPVSIGQDTRADFEQFAGPFLPQLIAILTRLEEDDLLDQGGVVFVEATSGAQLAKWPPGAMG